MTLEAQITQLIEDQLELITFLRATWKTLEKDYRREVMSTLDALVEHERKLEDRIFTERTAAYFEAAQETP